jgi:hypothetical protein
MSLRDFQQEAGELLRQIHVSSAIVGRGGLDRMTSEDYLAIDASSKFNTMTVKTPKPIAALDSST